MARARADRDGNRILPGIHALIPAEDADEDIEVFTEFDGTEPRVTAMLPTKASLALHLPSDRLRLRNWCSVSSPAKNAF